MYRFKLVALSFLAATTVSAYEMTTTPLHSHLSKFEGQVIELRDKGASSETIMDHVVAYLESQSEPVPQPVAHDILMALKSPLIIEAFQKAEIAAGSQIVQSKIETLRAVTAASPSLEALRLSVVQDWLRAGLWKQESKPAIKKKRGILAAETDEPENNRAQQTL